MAKGQIFVCTVCFEHHFEFQTTFRMCCFGAPCSLSAETCLEMCEIESISCFILNRQLQNYQVQQYVSGSIANT